MTEQREKAVFRVLIRGSMDQVWRELTKTDEAQAAMFNSRLHTPALAVGSPMQMRSLDGRFTNVVGRIVEIERPVRFSHTMRFTTSDDPEVTIVYDLKQVDEGVEFTLTVEDLPVGTKSAKQMLSGGKFITSTLKAVVEKGRPPLGTRLLFVLFKLMAPFAPRRARVENWPLETA